MKRKNLRNSSPNRSLLQVSRDLGTLKPQKGIGWGGGGPRGEGVILPLKRHAGKESRSRARPARQKKSGSRGKGEGRKADMMGGGIFRARGAVTGGRGEAALEENGRLGLLVRTGMKKKKKKEKKKKKRVEHWRSISHLVRKKTPEELL